MDLSGGINGVFKGGGAKGIVYAGALRAAEERGIEFKAVAGSSAGAITATLIAAGISAAELAESTLEGLKSVRLNIFQGFLPWVGKSLFSVDRLEGWLEERLRVPIKSHTGSDPTGPVTFKQLYDATHIELNVVAMDLARKQPVVFSDQTAPDCAVAPAVVASCAIPVAMPAGRVVIKGLDGGERVHRIVDGGAWANYPSFVFRDPSFRKFHELRTDPMDRPTVGFVISDPVSGDLPEPEKPIRMERRRRASDDLGSGRSSGQLGKLLNWGMFRYSALVAVPLTLGWILLFFLRDQLERFFPFVRSLPDAMEPFAIVGLLALFLILVAAAVPLAVIVFRLGHEVFDVGLPSAFAALSVGPGVPDWVGAESSVDPVVRLSTPWGISTTTFKISDEVRLWAIRRAHVEAGVQLDALMAGATEPVRLPTQASPLGGRTAVRWFFHPTDTRRWVRLGMFLMVVLAFGPLVAIGLARNILAGKVLPVVGVGLGLAVVILFLIAVAAHIRAVRATTKPTGQGWGRLWSVFVGFLALFSFVTVLMFLVDVGSVSRFADAERAPGRVTRVARQENPRVYEVRIEVPLGGIRGGSGASCDGDLPTTCLLFRSSLETLSVGDATEVLFIPSTGEVFLAGEEWKNDDLDDAAVNVGVWVALAVGAIWSIEDLVRNRRARKRVAA